MLMSDVLIPRALISLRAPKLQFSSFIPLLPHPLQKIYIMEKPLFINLGKDFSVRVHRGLEALTAAGADFPSIKFPPWPFPFVWKMSGGGKNHKYVVFFLQKMA